MSKEIDRRAFLRLSAAAAVGFAVAQVIPSINYISNRTVQEVTGRPTGNASIATKIEEECKSAPDPSECQDSYSFSAPEKFYITTAAPIIEELEFRLVPSYLLSEHEISDDSTKDIIYGTGGLGMTRRELVLGGSLSVLFGLIHNVTEKGIDTNRIPASQTASGMIYWYLQRKLGIVSNTVTHMLNNIKVLG